MSSSPACTCCVCPVHAEAGPEGGGPVGDGPEWARSAREHLDSVVDWLDGPEATGAGHGELEARLQVHSREQYRLLLQGQRSAGGCLVADAGSGVDGAAADRRIHPSRVINGSGTRCWLAERPEHGGSWQARQAD